MQTISTFKEFKKELLKSPTLQTEFKNDPVQAVQKISERPLDWDVWIYRIVVSALGLTILTIVIGIIVLIGTETVQGDDSIPTILTAIGSGAIGALAGLLAPSPKSVKE